MSIDNLYVFFKKINYKRILPVLLCPVFLFCTSISVFAADVSPDAQNEWFLLPFNQLYDIDGSFDDVSGTYYATGSDSATWLTFEVGFDNSSVLPILKKSHTYLIYGTVSLNTSNNTVRPYYMELLEFIGDSSKNYQSSGNYLYQHYDYNNSTYSISAIYSFTMEDDIFLNTGGALSWRQSEVINYSGRISWGFYALDITDTSESKVNQIIAAINNQTIQQNNNFNNFMGSGSQFGGTTSGIQSGNDELSGFIDDYTEVEQSMYDKFTENQTAVSGNFSGWSWGSLSTAVDWTSDYLNRIYDNSGDFRTMFMYPILAGIALIFIGRQGLTAYVRSRREK